MTNLAEFIVTETLGKYGEEGEKTVWETIKLAFESRECLAYWRYPIFSQTGEARKEPDILIVDRELGIIIIEVKSFFIDNLININGHLWQYKDYYLSSGSPYQQAENQLFSLMEFCEIEPTLKDNISAKVIIALPNINRGQWQENNFDKLPTQPPILFQDDLVDFSLLLTQIKQLPYIFKKEKLNQNQWQLLRAILGGNPVHFEENKRVLTDNKTKGSILNQLRKHLFELDIQQEKIAKQIPSGVQRIRGISGSGKTVILCQKAAIMHLKNPHWKIALVFFSRSLYYYLYHQLDQWLRYYSRDKVKYSHHNPNLKLLHGWGSRKQEGFYSNICYEIGIPYLIPNQTESKQPNEALAEACYKLLKEFAIPQLFDVILIDEAQDLLSENWQFEDKQPFFWMVYQSLIPVDPIHPELKRLIYAYDELQSLENLKIPTATELFGQELGNLLTGNYDHNIKKTEILPKCYRNPHHIITLAHGMAMGFYRQGQMITTIKTEDEWLALGYEVIESSSNNHNSSNLNSPQTITIKRPLENSPNPIHQLWQGDLITFQTYGDRLKELKALAQNIKHNLKVEGLRPSREILVIILGNFFEAIALENYTANFLIQQGIDIYIPSAGGCNIIKPEKDTHNPNQFWWEGAVTITRIHRAKGHQGDQVYLVGLDKIAQNESNIFLRHQLLIALTRARAWVNISGIGRYSLYEELSKLIRDKDTFNLTIRNSGKRALILTEIGEILNRYNSGERNFQNVNLSHQNLTRVNLKKANLIGANLQGANLNSAQLEGAKLIIADLSNSDLTQSNLKKANLMGANLRGANLENADLTEADLRDADLTEVKLNNTILHKTLLDETNF
jgi:superfamily I DNA and RNA helicase